MRQWMSPLPPSRKTKQDKTRGKKTKAQKMRKAAKLEKALAISQRTHSKVAKRDTRKQTKAATKGLWVNSSGKKAP